MLANHGFINRDGRNVEVTDLIRELQNNFPVIPEFSVTAAEGARTRGLFDDFNGVEVLNLDVIHKPNREGGLEHFASITRVDQNGDGITGFHISTDLEAMLLDANDESVVTRQELLDYQAERVRDGRRNTPGFDDAFTSGTPSAQMTLLMAFGQDPDFLTVPKHIIRSIFFREEVPATGYNPAFFPFLLNFAAEPFSVVRQEFRDNLDAVLQEPVDPTECDVEFILFNADTDTELGPLEAEVCLVPNTDFNIQARSTDACDPTLSAALQLSGPIDAQRTENSAPYMIFGDDANGNIFGRDYREGTYKISAQIYELRGRRGNLVVQGELEFTVEDCGRNLRSGNSH